MIASNKIALIETCIDDEHDGKSCYYLGHCSPKVDLILSLLSKNYLNLNVDGASWSVNIIFIE